MRIRLLLLFLFFTKIAFSQNSTNPEAKNTISVSGSYIFLDESASINYERLLFKLHDETKILLSVGYGKWFWVSNYNYGSTVIPITLNFLSGIGNNHFELDLGVAIETNLSEACYIFDYEKTNVTNPAYILNIGYRYQKPKGGILFRTYIGLEGIGIGLGYAF